MAQAQARFVADALGGAELVPVSTSGDEDREGAADQEVGDKSRFVSEVEAAVLEGDADLAVHSAKDLPAELADGLGIIAVPAREDPRDAFVGAADSLGSLPEGARIGTGSVRRRSQLLALRPDLRVEPVRGNVDTRLRRLSEGHFDGLIVAAAGLKRLGREGEIAFTLDPAEFVPAPGQGALAIEGRADGEPTTSISQLGDAKAADELNCERSVVASLAADCDTPLGVLARSGDGRLSVTAYCGLPDGSEWIRDTLVASDEDPVSLGSQLAARLRGAGADELLERASAGNRAEDA